MPNVYPDGYIIGFCCHFFLDISEDRQDLGKITAKTNNQQTAQENRNNYIQNHTISKTSLWQSTTAFYYLIPLAQGSRNSIIGKALK